MLIGNFWTSVRFTFLILLLYLSSITSYWRTKTHEHRIHTLGFGILLLYMDFVVVCYVESLFEIIAAIQLYRGSMCGTGPAATTLEGFTVVWDQ